MDPQVVFLEPKRIEIEVLVVDAVEAGAGASLNDEVIRNNMIRARVVCEQRCAEDEGEGARACAEFMHYSPPPGLTLGGFRHGRIELRDRAAGDVKDAAGRDGFQDGGGGTAIATVVEGRSNRQVFVGRGRYFEVVHAVVEAAEAAQIDRGDFPLGGGARREAVRA